MDYPFRFVYLWLNQSENAKKEKKSYENAGKVDMQLNVRTVQVAFKILFIALDLRGHEGKQCLDI